MTKLFQDLQLFGLLLTADMLIANQIRARGCRVCGSVLHAGDYPRRPRGEPPEVTEAYSRRFSFCCSRRSCRRRVTPPSLRFLGRRVYLGVVVVLVAARVRINKGYVEELRRLFRCSQLALRTIRRWKAWWLGPFRRGACWRRARALFMPPVDELDLPRSLIAAFRGSARRRLAELLEIVKPVTTSSTPWRARLMRGLPLPQRM